MTTYLTVAELRARWGASRVDGLAGGDEAAIEASIAQAERELEESLRVRYGAQLSEVRDARPASATDLVADLALLRLYRHRGYDQPPADAVDAAAAAERRISRIARGLADLGITGDPAIDVSRPSIGVARPPSAAHLRREVLDLW